MNEYIMCLKISKTEYIDCGLHQHDRYLAQMVYVWERMTLVSWELDSILSWVCYLFMTKADITIFISKLGLLFEDEMFT